MTQVASPIQTQDKRPYRPYGAALQAWRSGRRECLLAGAANTGKSRCGIEKLHYCADAYKEMRGLMVRKTRKSLTQTAMVTYEKKVLPRGWLDSLIHFNTTDQQYEYPNGSIIAVAGLDDPQKVMSSEWDMIYVQEATELDEAAWEALTIRLRNHVMPYQQLIADCNPSYPTHWLKMRGDRGATQMLDSRHEDNPSITPEDIATLDALTGVRYLRLRLGKWAAAEGIVYEQWDRSKHLVTMQQLKKWGIYNEYGVNRHVVRRVIGSTDWGFTNPGCLQVWCVDGDARMYQVCEVYRTKRTIDWWIIQAQALQREFSIEQWVCDPSEPAYILQFNGAGLNAIGAENAIVPGISHVQARLLVAGDGRPRIFIYEDSLRERDELLEKAHKPLCFEQEIDAYVWPQAKDGHPVKEIPVDENNHSLDAGRYAVAHLDFGEGDIEELDQDVVQAISGYVGY